MRGNGLLGDIAIDDVSVTQSRCASKLLLKLSHLKAKQFGVNHGFRNEKFHIGCWFSFVWFLFWINDSNTCICCIEELILQSVEQILLNTESCFIQDNHLVLALFHKQPPPHQWPPLSGLARAEPLRRPIHSHVSYWGRSAFHLCNHHHKC